MGREPAASAGARLHRPGDDGDATETVRTSKHSLVLTAFPDVEIPLSELGLDRPR